VHAAAACVYARRFEQKGFKLVALKMMQADEKLLKEHYKDLVSKPFFPGLLSYMTSGPVVPMVWEGDGVVKAGRTILGATKPAESAPGTVRGDYAIDVGRNVCHGIALMHFWCQCVASFVLLVSCVCGWSMQCCPAFARVCMMHLMVSYTTCVILCTHRAPHAGSDAVETAKIEIGLWFKEGITKWDSHSESWVYEKV